KGADRWLLVSYDRDTIRPNAMGKFSDLLQATAQSPAMLFYLDNFQSVSPNAQPAGGSRPGAQRGPLAQLLMGDRANNRPQIRMSNNPEQQRPQQQARRGINENYARELMELHTLGVDGGYTQRDVEALARILTGWSLDLGGGELSRFYPRRHDFSDKVFLGRRLKGRGAAELDEALDILAREPGRAALRARHARRLSAHAHRLGEPGPARDALRDRTRHRLPRPGAHPGDPGAAARRGDARDAGAGIVAAGVESARAVLAGVHAPMKRRAFLLSSLGLAASGRLFAAPSAAA